MPAHVVVSGQYYTPEIPPPGLEHLLSEHEVRPDAHRRTPRPRQVDPAVSPEVGNVHGEPAACLRLGGDGRPSNGVGRRGAGGRGLCPRSHPGYGGQRPAGDGRPGQLEYPSPGNGAVGRPAGRLVAEALPVHGATAERNKATCRNMSPLFLRRPPVGLPTLIVYHCGGIRKFREGALTGARLPAVRRSGTGRGTPAPRSSSSGAHVVFGGTACLDSVAFPGLSAMVSAGVNSSAALKHRILFGTALLGHPRRCRNGCDEHPVLVRFDHHRVAPRGLHARLLESATPFGLRRAACSYRNVLPVDLRLRTSPPSRLVHCREAALRQRDHMQPSPCFQRRRPRSAQPKARQTFKGRPRLPSATFGRRNIGRLPGEERPRRRGTGTASGSGSIATFCVAGVTSGDNVTGFDRDRTDGAPESGAR
jgi:hypothetical protein